MIGQLCCGHMGDTEAGVGSYSLGHGLLEWWKSGGQRGICGDESRLGFWEIFLI